MLGWPSQFGRMVGGEDGQISSQLRRNVVAQRPIRDLTKEAREGE
jgi:hypothetical protein